MHTDWGRASQKTVRTTRWIQYGNREVIGEMEFEFRSAGK